MVRPGVARRIRRVSASTAPSMFTVCGLFTAAVNMAPTVNLRRLGGCYGIRWTPRRWTVGAGQPGDQHRLPADELARETVQGAMLLGARRAGDRTLGGLAARIGCRPRLTVPDPSGGQSLTVCERRVRSRNPRWLLPAGRTAPSITGSPHGLTWLTPPGGMGAER